MTNWKGYVVVIFSTNKKRVRGPMHASQSPRATHDSCQLQIATSIAVESCWRPIVCEHSSQQPPWQWHCHAICTRPFECSYMQAPLLRTLPIRYLTHSCLLSMGH
jgi:hypothetical protein